MSKKALDSNLDFDGMAGDGVNRSGNKYSGNQYATTMKENFGKKTIKGAPEAYACDHGKSVTKDTFRTAPDTAKGGKINGGARAECPSNPDKINVGSK